MKENIRILFVEDNPSDVDLAERVIHNEGLSFSSLRVETQPDLLKALDEFNPDVIICDYSMPAFDGKKALEIVLRFNKDLPVIMFTGSVREHIAVECMKAGASDYVIKEHIDRLPFAIKESIEKREIRIKAELAITELNVNKSRLFSLFEKSPVSITEEDYSEVKKFTDELLASGITDLKKYFDENPAAVRKCFSIIKIIDINETGVKTIGAKSKSYFLENVDKYINIQDDLNPRKKIILALVDGRTKYEGSCRMKVQSGEEIDFYYTLSVVPGYEDTLSRIIVNLFDITELSKAKQQLDSNLNLIEKILAASPNLIYIYDLHKKEYIYTNQEIINTLGYTPSQIRSFGSSVVEKLIHPDDVNNMVEFQKKYINISFGEVYEIDYRIRHAEGHWLWLHSRDVLFSKDPDGNVKQILGMATDITSNKIYEENLLRMSKDEQERNNALIKSNEELIAICEIAVRTTVELQNEIENRKNIELKIRQAQAQLETVLESLTDIILVSIDRDFRQICYNSAHVKAIKLEYNKDVVIGENLLDCIGLESDREIAKTNYDLCFSGKSHVAIECIGKNKDYYEVRYNPVYNESSEVIGATAILTNINKRIYAENEIREKNIQLQKLNKHIVEIRENERSLISREIHDQLGQSLTALKMDLTCFINDSTTNNDDKGKLQSMIDLVTATISDVQRISAELRPGILDDLGLAPAIEWYCDEFERRYGLQLNLSLNNVQSDNINDNLTIYRVMQESLTNIVRHAQAKSVTIKLKEIKKCISFTVKDDGIGISPRKIKSSGSLGLRGMYERVKQSGGTIRISSPGNSGTKIQVYIPIYSSSK
jgi:two-component system, NarL family, sensor histidine kinase UhpB